MSLRTGVEYVAAVYLIVWLVVLGYMWLIGQKLARLQREVERLEQQGRPSAPAEEPAENAASLGPT
jgi:CcmD family protein